MNTRWAGVVFGCAILVAGGCNRLRPQAPMLEKVQAPLRESFQAAASGDLPDTIAAATPIALELTKEDGKPAALSAPGARILAIGPKTVAVEGLRASDWRALMQDGMVSSIALHSVNVVKDRLTAGLGTETAPRDRDFLSELAGLQGDGLAVALIDEGAADATHPEFNSGGGSRIIVPTRIPVKEHSTAMASIIGARGASGGTKGVAPGAKIYSYFYGTTEFTEIMNAMTHGVETEHAAVSNHSYGPPVGWEVITPSSTASPPARWYGVDIFGRYDATHSAMDGFLAAHPSHLAFAAAGNERGEYGVGCPIGAPQCCVPHEESIHGVWQVVTTCHPRDGGDGGVDTLKGACVAKNSICVTNVERTGTSSWVLQQGTGWGPTDDLRIKPDLAAEGYEVKVATGTSTTAGPQWGHSSGTSSATAMASGIGLLLTQHYMTVNGRQPLAAEIKAALIHTSVRERPEHPVPTFQKGWGVINASAAARVITGRDGARLIRGEYRAPSEMALTATGGPIRVTLVWTDRAAPPGSSHSLVNDLDIELRSSTGQVVLPWSYNGSVVRQEANHHDNVEVIDATATAGSAWRLRLSATGINGTQPYALVISGATVPR